MPRFFVRRVIRLVIACALAGQPIISGTAFAQESGSSGPRPVGRAFALDRAPALDGNVQDDPAWAGVTPLTGLVQTQPNA
ncbi:MAG: hypothetical protein OEV41_13115, partial [Gammaproteobacteria bacterium]|nr:hypothetical protein [Gammaproteobacteria bacterium]